VFLGVLVNVIRGEIKMKEEYINKGKGLGKMKVAYMKKGYVWYSTKTWIDDDNRLHEDRVYDILQEELEK